MHEYPSDVALESVASERSEPSCRNYANVVTIFLALCLLPVMSHAGGLGIAPLALAVGIMGYLTVRPSSTVAIPSWVWALAAFLIWANISAIWSPYVDKQTLTNPVKIGIGAFLFLGSILGFRLASKVSSNVLRHMVIAVSVIICGLVIIDCVTGYGFTFYVDPVKEGEDIVRRVGDTEMNIGHAITVLVLLMPGVMLMIVNGRALGWGLALLFAGAVIFAGAAGQLMVGVLGAVFALIAMAAAHFRPVLTLRGLIWLAITAILAAPLFGILVSYATPEIKAALPFSWEHRLEMWGYTGHRILESPLWGHGFDSVRTFDAKFSSRGIVDWAVVSLHPHNAGLHIWAETGLIGAALAVTTLLLIGRSLEVFIYRSPSRAMAVCGFIAATTLICSVTYGVWQDWWWASIILVASSLLLINDPKGAVEHQ